MTMHKAMHFIEPLDILFLRGNKLFGDPGSFGESLIPPWPSVAAGALRSALLAHKGTDLARFAGNEIDDPELGSPERPGSFRVTAFHLARRSQDGPTGSEPLLPLPADLGLARQDDGKLEIRRLAPLPYRDGPHRDILCSTATPSLAVLPERRRGKPEAGFWLTGEGWGRHLRGEELDPDVHLLPKSALWRIDTRIGVGLDPARRTAAEGKLFTMQAIALRKAEHHRQEPEGDRFDVGFLAETTGAEMPETLTLRFGGDGRGALARQVSAVLPEPDYAAIAEAGRCRMILTTPGLFPGGWRPTGTEGSGSELRFRLHSVAARLTCAAVPRSEIVSGFDIARRRPKPAQRAAPVGSVYWLEDLDATPEALRNLAVRGLWSEPVDNTARRAEGFNRCAFAEY